MLDRNQLYFPYMCKITVIQSECIEGRSKKGSKTPKILLPQSTEERNSVLSSLTTQGGDGFNIKHPLVRD